MKRKVNTHALTQEEYNQFFSDDITVRRKKELAEKIVRRLSYISSTLVDCDIDEDYFDPSYVLANYDYKQKAKDPLNINGDYGCFYFINDEGDMYPIEVCFLWDENKLREAIQKVEEYQVEEKNKKKKLEEEENSVKLFILSQFNKEQINVIKRNIKVFARL